MAFRLPTFTRSAIMVAECRFQERNTAQPGRFRRWLGRGVLNLTLVISLVLFGGEIAGALLYRDATPISDALGPLTAFAVAVVVTLHFVLMFQTLSLSANSIAHEKLKQTWEVLILTGIDARTVVLGKWWATVRRMGRQYLLLGLLRACIIGWVGAATSRSLYAYFNTTYGGYSRITTPALFQFLLLVLVIMAFTLANLGFTAACGVAASAQSRQPVMALIRAFALRTTLLVATSIALGLLVAQFQIYFFVTGINGELFGVLPLVVVGLLDNGGTSAMTLASYGTPGVQVGAILFMALITLALYGGLTWFMLRQAEKQAVKHQALRHPRTMRVPGFRQ